MSVKEQFGVVNNGISLTVGILCSFSPFRVKVKEGGVLLSTTIGNSHPAGNIIVDNNCLWPNVTIYWNQQISPNANISKFTILDEYLYMDMYRWCMLVFTLFQWTVDGVNADERAMSAFMSFDTPCLLVPSKIIQCSLISALWRTGRFIFIYNLFN